MSSFNHLPKGSTIAVGMSGGVDSSVSALLLKEAGFNVFGLFMKNWEENDEFGQCRASKDQEDAQKVCTLLDIPFYTVNFTDEYYDLVFQDLLSGLKVGLTPNPDILCNKEIKFNLFLKKALALGADFLATGHYCQIASSNEGFSLLKGSDGNKDQTYFVYTLSQQLLSKIIFPIGHLEKKVVREIASAANLPTSEKKDSTGICFIGKRNFKEFISQYITQEKGPIFSTEGKLLGEHQGAIYYTIGQRKGLGIGGEGDAWFVADKDVKKNTLIVAQGQDHPLLYCSFLKAKRFSFTTKEKPTFPLTCKAKIRYRQEDQECTVTEQSDHLLVEFSTPQRAVTQGQSIVFYQNDLCLGGGIILEKW